MNHQHTTNMSIRPNTYLGDSVYAEFGAGGIELTTENGYTDHPRNRIVLEPAVYAALLRWVDEQQPKPIGAAAAKIEAVKAVHRYEIAQLESMAVVLNRVPASLAGKCSLWCHQLDFNQLTREESVAVMAALHAGKWAKSVNSSYPDMIDYEGEVDGVKVRLWAAAPPDSCRVIEVEEVLPATTIKRRKLVCSEGAL